MELALPILDGGFEWMAALCRSVCGRRHSRHSTARSGPLKPAVCSSGCRAKAIDHYCDKTVIAVRPLWQRLCHQNLPFLINRNSGMRGSMLFPGLPAALSQKISASETVSHLHCARVIVFPRDRYFASVPA